MLADPGSYEERYRLTGAALGLVSALLALGLGFLWYTQLIFTALTVLLAIPAVLALARPPAALRADHADMRSGVSIRGVVDFIPAG
jgi:cation transport ATPase